MLGLQNEIMKKMLSTRGRERYRKIWKKYFKKNERRHGEIRRHVFINFVCVCKHNTGSSSYACINSAGGNKISLNQRKHRTLSSNQSKQCNGIRDIDPKF